jgi:hypothetical protein
MTHQCPKCELRFSWVTELDDHCRTDHPGFRHGYPVHGEHHADDAPEEPTAAPPVPPKPLRTDSILSTWWSER